jgi:Zn-dependent membrane protease YugP
MFFDSNYLLLVFLPTLLISGWAQLKLRSAMSKWSQIPNSAGLTGVETARLIMSHAGLTHVGIASVEGQMTDFYDPRDKSIHLSESSTGRPSVAAMAIVAHELGHAQQDQTGNAMLNLRARLVPVANIGTRLGLGLVMLGLIFQMTQLATVGVVLFAGFVAFTLVTLPVEFDASKRAKRILDEMGIVNAQEAAGVKAVLDAAALTYVAAAATAILQLLYYLSLVQRRN